MSYTGDASPDNKAWQGRNFRGLRFRRPILFHYASGGLSHFLSLLGNSLTFAKEARWRLAVVSEYHQPLGAPLRNSNFAKRVYKPALKRLGLPDIRIHDLRHTAVSVAKSVGGDIFDAKNQVGHSDIRTTINIYGHIFEEDSLDLAQKLDIALKNVH